MLFTVMRRLRERHVLAGRNNKFHLGPSKCGMLVRYLSEYA